MIRAFIVAIVLFAFAPFLAHAQDTPQPTTTLTVQARVVAIDAVVRNPDGDLLRSLDKDAFTLKVDGKPTDIRYFNRDNDLPLTIGLMIDTSGSLRRYFDQEALSSELFFENVLTHPKDSALVVCFDSRVVTLQPMTSRLPELRNALRLLDYRAPETGPGATFLYDAIIATAKSVVSKEPGRRALIIMTDGDDNGSHASLSEAIRQAQLADVAVYTVLFTTEIIGGVRYPTAGAPRPSGIDVMQQISKATGGRTFIVGTGKGISQIYADIEQELRSQYRFGFTPLPSKPGKFHSLELRTGNKRETIQARTGYYTPE